MEARLGLNHDQNTLRTWLEHDFNRTGFSRSIHVAGTNGKGSVITWLECLLHAAGNTSGSFISPHLITHNERFRLNGKPISLDEWEEVFDMLDPSFETRNMTMFEMDLFMTVSIFDAHQPDWTLIETGLGGTYDATTAMDYPIGIITRIGMDHMGYLGNTKEEIARAKAGIIKSGMTIITAEPDPACVQIFKEQADACGAKLIEADTNATLDEDIWNSELPAYQKENFITAKTALEAAGFSFTNAQLKEAVERFSWPARFQMLRRHPLLLLDGAHNPDGIQALVTSLQQSPLHIEQIFFSVLADKQAHEMISMLQTLDASITLVRFESYRLAELDELAQNYDMKVISMEDMLKELHSAEKSTLCCGSLYFAGEILAHFSQEGL